MKIARDFAPRVAPPHGAAKARGFTLLELIVVIGIFAIFATMAYGGLDSVLKTRVHVEQALTRTEDYDRAYLRLRTDFQDAATRSVRDANGEPLAGFAFDTYNRRVEFTRNGWQNLLSLPRSTLERVSYFLDDAQPEGSRAAPGRLDDKHLVRRSWLVLDRAPQTKSVDVTLLDHVEDLNWRFLDASNVWQDSWPGNSGTVAASAATLEPPIAIEVKLRTKDWGDLRFLFRVGAEGAAKLANLTKGIGGAGPPGGKNGPPGDGNTKNGGNGDGPGDDPGDGKGKQ